MRERLPSKEGPAFWVHSLFEGPSNIIPWAGARSEDDSAGERESSARGEKAAKAKLQEIAQLPIQIVGVDTELVEVAASLKAEHNLPYADCFAAALAQARKATLVTSDRGFERVGTAVNILLWV